MTTRTPQLTPAYCRDYTSKKEVLADFDANRDFILHDMTSRWSGKPCNKHTLAKYSTYTEVQFRYNKQRKTFLHQLT